MKEHNEFILRSQSMYDKLLKGEIGGEDIKLHFVEEESNLLKQKGERRNYLPTEPSSVHVV